MGEGLPLLLRKSRAWYSSSSVDSDKVTKAVVSVGHIYKRILGTPSTAGGDGTGETHTVRVVMAMVRHSHVAAVDIVLAMAGVVIVLLKPVSTHTCTRHRTAVTLRLCDFLNYVDGCL